MIYFTSDLHLDNANIIPLCKRPFSSVEEMNATIINNWNSIITSDDTVYVLGDFAYHNHKKHLALLNGRKILIRGNHDRDARLAHGWYVIYEYYKLKQDDDNIVLFHFPILEWDGFYRNNSYHLYGHCHGNNKHHDKRAKDVGVDINQFIPKKFQDFYK